MKVVVTRKLPYDISGELKDFRVDYNSLDEPLPTIRLRQMLTDADGLICTLTDTIDRTMMESSSKLKVIANFGVGYNNIDVDYARQRGITVCTTPHTLTQSTAELGIALMLASARRLAEGDRMVRSGKFIGASPSLLLGAGLHKKTLGVFGMGNIGQAAAKIASGFSMDIIYHNRNRNFQAELLLGATYATFDELLEWSDFLMIAAPLTPETKHRFSLSEFKRMKKTAVLINIGRGPIIREADLAVALKERMIFSAGLDVYEFEPEVNETLRSLDNVTLLPHIGSATQDARSAMAKMCAEGVISVLKNGIIPDWAITRIT